MANKDLFKQAIAEAKSVREAAIANAKEALEETLTPHLKDMLAAKLQEMEDKTVEEEVVNEVEEEVEEAKHHDKDDAMEEGSKEDKMEEEIEEGDYGDDDAMEEADDEGEEAPEEAKEESDDEPADDEDLKDLSVEDFKDLIRDIISQEMGADGDEMDAELPADDMDAGADLEEPGEGDPMAGEEGDEEIDLDELLKELESVSEGESEEEMEEGKKEDKMEEKIDEDTSNEVPAESETKEKNLNRTVKEEVSNELSEALETIETLRKELNEVNLLNSKLLYVNKIFKANNLSESQKVNIIAAFDKAESVKEVKLVFETVSDNVVAKKESTIKEHKGSASKATGTTASKPEVIAEVSDAVLRMQKLAGIIKS